MYNIPDYCMQMRAIIIILIITTILACKKNEKSGIYCPPEIEILIYDSIVTTTEDDHGFFFFDPPKSLGNNWVSPCDFYNGLFYFRFEVIELPNDTSFFINFCIWADVEGDWITWKETCCDHVEIDGKGIFTANSVPTTWYIKNTPVDFSRVNDFERLGIALWCDDYRNLTDWTFPESSCWNDRGFLLPLTLRITVVAVAKGNTFSGWENHI